MYKLKIITSTVRPGRKGPIIARWIAEKAEATGNFKTEVLDLGEINLPVMNEPNHPMLKNYVHEYTRQWSAKIDEADAFVFVTAEYDWSYPAALKNAMEYLAQEWGYKAAGIVSYGGVSAGTRASNALKNDLTTFKIMPLAEQVNVPFFTQFINAEGVFAPNEITEKSAQNMLRELNRWTKGMQFIKENK